MWISVKKERMCVHFRGIYFPILSLQEGGINCTLCLFGDNHWYLRQMPTFLLLLLTIYEILLIENAIKISFGWSGSIGVLLFQSWGRKKWKFLNMLPT